MKERSRASFSGTAGYRIGYTLMPRSNSRAARVELPTTGGMTASPALVPVSMPAAGASSRNSAPCSRRALARCGSPRSHSRAAREAAATGGAMPTP
jgi:hypothetical protein